MIKKLIVGAVVTGTVIYVGKKIADRTGVTERVSALAEAAVAKAVEGLNDALTAYDHWTNNLVGEDDNDAQKFSDEHHAPWQRATRDEVREGA